MCARNPESPYVAQHEPELERAEAAAQRDLPVAVVDDRARLRRSVAQVLRDHAQRADQRRAIPHVERGQVEVREQPLVRVEDVGVRVLQAGVDEAQLLADRGAAGERPVDVKPDAVAPAQISAIAGTGSIAVEEVEPTVASPWRVSRPRQGQRPAPAAAPRRSGRAPRPSATSRSCALRRAPRSGRPSPARSARAVRRRPRAARSVFRRASSHQRSPAPGRQQRGQASPTRRSPGSTPPPLPSPGTRPAGRAHRSTSQSSTCCSTSVAAGPVDHSIPCDASRGRDQIGQHRGRRRVPREVREEARVLPLRDPRHHDPRRGRPAPPRTAAAPRAQRPAAAPAPRRAAPGRARAGRRRTPSSPRSSPRPGGPARGTRPASGAAHSCLGD